MTTQKARRLDGPETMVLGAVCMALATGLCLALFVGLGSGPTERAQRIRRKMSLIAADATASALRRDGPSTDDRATTRPAHMNALLADLGLAEMDLRMKRGIAMILSMVVSMGLFLGLRALRSKPVGPAVRFGERGAA